MIRARDGDRLQGSTAPDADFHRLKLFTCGDRSGAIVVRPEARADAKGDDFHWVVATGSGAYITLRGTRSGHGTSPGDPSIVIDTFEGGLHLD